MGNMGMPAPADQHRKLQALAGSWTGEEKLYPSPWDQAGGTATGRIEARAALDGFFVVSDYQQERGGQVTYRGHGVYGYDTQKGRYTLHWFDSMGMVPAAPAMGVWEGNVLTFAQQTPMGHARYVYTFHSETRHTFKLEQSQDGKAWATFMEANYTRK